MAKKQKNKKRIIKKRIDSPIKKKKPKSPAAVKTNKKQKKKSNITKSNTSLIEEVVTELVGPEALPFVMYLRDKSNVSEFKIAEDVKEEIHRTRNVLYRLLEHNIVSFKRKKDKVKGWYICYWDFNEHNISYLRKKIIENKIIRLRERLGKELTNTFFMCKNACTRVDFDVAVEFNFKCPECGEIMNEQDNSRTIEVIKQRLKQLQTITV